MTRSTAGETPDKKEHDWHPLPQMIGNAIVGNIKEIAACGQWVVEMNGGDVLVHRIIDEASDKADLPEAADTRQIWDAYVALELHAKIPEPESGWDDETEPVGEDHWGGYR